jgi:UDP-3-O-[3-hydroxymyristoyl] glucosamine N-acyltransferase
VGISGSTKLGKSVIVGGQVGMAGHIKIGDNVMIAATASIHKNIKSGQIVAGSPHTSHKEWLKIEACRLRLPRMRATLEELVKKVEYLQEKINKSSSEG